MGQDRAPTFLYLRRLTVAAVHEGVNELNSRRLFPSSQRRGGCGIK